MVYWFMGSIIILGVSCFLVDNEILRLRFIPILIVAWVGLSIWKRKYIFREDDSRNIWHMYTITCGILIVLCANSIFSADLTKIRFVQILIPFMLILLYRNATKRVLQLVTGIFFVSGILYIHSNMIGWWYAPSVVKVDHPIVYENEYAYSTQYFYERNEVEPKPVFLGDTGFEKWCRVCEMGSVGTISNTDERIGIISQYGRDMKSVIPESMKLIRSELLISRTDEYFLARLHPIENRLYQLSVYARVHPSQ